MKFMIRHCAALRSPLAALGLPVISAGCAHRNIVSSAAGADATTRALRSKIDTIVVIYAENRAFDNLYGRFPGAHGLSEVVDQDGRPRSTSMPQTDRDGSVLPTLPPTWGGVPA